jgi:RsiW-degrading membrane proteinase PrsW (M82 family)
LLLNPGVLVLVFAFISVIVPVIEEALKPLGLWFLAGQRITPAQGFGYGVLCGAGFGLFENLGNTSMGGETWALLTATRASTLLLHCLNSGLVGWGLASVWTHRRYLRLAATFLYAVTIHGLWNGLAVLSLMGSLEGETSISIPASLVQAGSYAPIGIVALAAFNLVFYLGFNSTMRKSLPSTPSVPAGNTPSSPQTIPPLSPQMDENYPPETNP